MPSAEIELDDRHKTLDVIIYGGDVEEHFRVAHEAGSELSAGAFGETLGMMRPTLLFSRAYFGARE